MKALVVYDSLHGNTHNIADLIGRLLSSDYSVKVKHVNQMRVSDLSSVQLLVVGSPTHGGRPTPAISQFLDSLPSLSLSKVSVIAFDTRFNSSLQKFPLRLLMGLIGYAAPKLSPLLNLKAQ